MRIAFYFLALLLVALSATRSEAFDLSPIVSFDGYADARLIAPSEQTSWVNGGLGKFRYGGDSGNFRFAEAVGQVDAALDDQLHVIAVVRAEPEDPNVVDALEAYARYTPESNNDLSWSVKAGAFFPTISLENDDLGWTSPYTLTPSAINSWIGDELRTIGSEGIAKWHTELGTFSAMGALYCCNEPAGILLADRGWTMDDRPTGLFERVLLPNATEALFHVTPPVRTGEFEEIDGQVGWYAGLGWEMSGIGKIQIVRYDNNANDAAKTAHDTAWATRFWSIGARTQFGPLVLISQGITGNTGIQPVPSLNIYTDFQAAFLLASYDLDDWRISIREDLFQTRREDAPGSPFSEDGHALTTAVSWSAYDWLRLTGEWITMDSRRGEYILDGLSSPEQNDSQFQLAARFLF